MRVVHLHLSAQHTFPVCLSCVFSEISSRPQLSPVRFSNNQEGEKKLALTREGVRKQCPSSWAGQPTAPQPAAHLAPPPQGHHHGGRGRLRHRPAGRALQGGRRVRGLPQEDDAGLPLPAQPLGACSLAPQGLGAGVGLEGAAGVPPACPQQAADFPFDLWTPQNNPRRPYY
jgi:hypothetical protein